MIFSFRSMRTYNQTCAETSSLELNVFNKHLNTSSFLQTHEQVSSLDGLIFNFR